jgi:hypothetical protein
MTGWDLSRTAWRKSSHSGEQGGTCVEVAALGRAVAVRDSKNPDGPALRFAPAEWSTFLTAVKGQGDRH